MRAHRPVSATLMALVALALLVVTACEAPLEPESRRSADRTTAPSPSASADPGTGTASPPTGTPTPRAPAAPSIVVPTQLASPSRDAVIPGADASWPQCPKGMGIPEKRSFGAPMPLPTARFVVLGLTNGPGFYPNPCLASQVAWVKERHLLAAAYSIISWPDARTLRRYRDQGPYDGSTRAGALANVGYQQARFNLATMQQAGLTSPAIWVDVEPVAKFEWSNDVAANAAVVEGAARGYRDAGYLVGAYSTQYLWQTVVGGLRLGVPEWRAAGETSRAEALRRCARRASFQGGPAVLSQWLQAGRDHDVTCPGTALVMGRWFHQY